MPKKPIAIADLKGSREFQRLNPHLYKPTEPASAAPISANLPPLSPKLTQDSGNGAKLGKRRKQMNRTETEFSHRLQVMLKSGEIVDWEYESTTLRWGEIDPISYTPDFTVTSHTILAGEDSYPFTKIIFIEVKGAHIWAKDIQKFKAARNQFTRFEFQLFQKKHQEWNQVL